MGIHEAGFQDPADVQIGPAKITETKQKGSPARSLQQMVNLDYKSSSKRLKTNPSSSLRCMILTPFTKLVSKIRQMYKLDQLRSQRLNKIRQMYKLDQLRSQRLNKRISRKKSSTNGQFGLQILQQEIEDQSIKFT